jgi:AraC-like DNA-binding protein/DNA gyrase inhibitor GyrI
MIEEIEENLSSNINPEIIAKNHFLSLRQFHREFYNITGHTVGEYIRLRRISNACAKIKLSDLSLDFIANESGYETQQAFNKQFKNIVGMTPLEYKKGDSYFCFYPVTEHETPVAVRVGVEKIPAWDVSFFYDTSYIGMENRALDTLDSKNSRVFGRSGKQFGNRFCYELMTENQGEKRSVFCAVSTVRYDEKTINNAWNYLYNIWLPNSSFTHTDEKYFEEYLFRNGKPYRLRLFLPIEKRKNYKHIVMCEQTEKSYIIAEENGTDAEHRASKRLIKFVRKHFPLLLQNARQFLVCENNDSYICGVACDKNIKLPENSGFSVKAISAGRYAALEDVCVGDTAVGKTKIETWLKNNSITHGDDPIFAVYESKDGNFDEENVTMTLYKKLK